MVPLLPGGFGAAGALARSPTTTGMMKPAVAASMPLATSTRPRVESTSDVFATLLLLSPDARSRRLLRNSAQRDGGVTDRRDLSDRDATMPPRHDPEPDRHQLGTRAFGL
jgi:hypothetical protein